MSTLEYFYKYYFRVRAIGLDNLPARGPALLVGNHSGGAVAADAAMTFYLWVRERGIEPPAYSLIEPAMFSIPGVSAHISKCGGLRAHPRMAVEALEDGGLVLVYPGGGDDAFRPYSKRHEIELGGNEAFIKLALRYRVPIVPVVTTGAHDTIIVLDEAKNSPKVWASTNLESTGYPFLSPCWGLASEYIIPNTISGTDQHRRGTPEPYVSGNGSVRCKESRRRRAQCFETVLQACEPFRTAF